jgi:hypothetical protein
METGKDIARKRLEGIEVQRGIEKPLAELSEFLSEFLDTKIELAVGIETLDMSPVTSFWLRIYVTKDHVVFKFSEPNMVTTDWEHISYKIDSKTNIEVIKDCFVDNYSFWVNKFDDFEIKENI